MDLGNDYYILLLCIMAKKNRDENLVIGPRKNTLWQERNRVKIAQLNIIKKIQWGLVTWIWEECKKNLIFVLLRSKGWKTVRSFCQADFNDIIEDGQILAKHGVSTKPLPFIITVNMTAYLFIFNLHLQLMYHHSFLTEILNHIVWFFWCVLLSWVNDLLVNLDKHLASTF